MGKILVVDDDPNNGHLISLVLNMHQVYVTYSGMQALEYIKTATPDLILLDQRMPEMDGLMTLEAMKKVNPNLQFIMITAEGSLGLAVDVMKRGALDFVSKPFNSEGLKHTVNRALDYVAVLNEKRQIEEILKNQQDAYQARLQEEVTLRTKEAEESRIKAENANKAKSEFLANMSHELRTPMHGILSFSKFGIDRFDKVEKEKLFEYFKEIRLCGERLMVLINQLLDLSKLESGKMDFDFQVGDFSVILRDILAEMNGISQERGITIVHEGEGSLAPISMDSLKVMQVMRNLLANAIKFSNPGSTVKVCVRQLENNLECAVIDHGIGIPEGELEKIFDPFVQSSKSKTGAGGTGLGLTIARNIISAHHGRIWAVNNPHGGAQIIFTLPLKLMHEKGAVHI